MRTACRRLTATRHLLPQCSAANLPTVWIPAKHMSTWDGQPFAQNMLSSLYCGCAPVSLRFAQGACAWRTIGVTSLAHACRARKPGGVHAAGHVYPGGCERHSARRGQQARCAPICARLWAAAPRLLGVPVQFPIATLAAAASLVQGALSTAFLACNSEQR